MMPTVLYEEACHLNYFEYTYPTHSIMVLRMQVE